MGREVVRLRQQLDHLENSQRHMLGENLSVLTVPDLLLLEQQLDMGVSRIRARKASARSLLKAKKARLTLCIEKGVGVA
jgi:hypothetical protein